MSMRRFCLTALAAAALACGASGTRAQAPSIWTDVMSKKKITTCIVPSYQPYSWKDGSGVWHGFVSEMARNVADALHVQVEFIESSFKVVILDIQSGKCDMFFGFNATPERALAIDFAGPLYTLGFIFINRSGFEPPGNGWVDYNSPNIRICYPLGTSMEQQIKRWDPKATQLALGSTDECLLAVQSGRADAYLAATLDGLATKHKNPQVGNLLFPQPSYALPSYAGMRLDSDGRFQKFMQRWSEYNRANGNISEWLIGALEEYGIPRDTLPKNIQF
jgi:polar amino acid transport system substrate-binding protein